jgi:hypothetical protein
MSPRTRLVLALLAAALARCTGSSEIPPVVADQPVSAPLDYHIVSADAPRPAADLPSGKADRPSLKNDSALPPRPFPDVSAANVNCTTWVVGDKVKAMQIYDSYFAGFMPKAEADFQWHVDANVLSPATVERVAFREPTTGQGDTTYHKLFDFNPVEFERTTAKTNWDIFGGFNPQTDRDAPYRKYNPTDLVPATSTHYARTTTDVIATQFVLRVACMKSQMQKGLGLCPDCNDVIVALSKYDEFKIFEVRFSRVRQGQLEVSKILKMISVDCSGDMVLHSAVAPYLFGTVGGKTLTAKWRGEISGLMAQTLGTYMKPTPLLIRLSSVNGPY